MKAPVYDSTGKKTSTLELPQVLFAAKVSPKLMAQYIRVYLSRQRQGTKEAKTRGKVSISTAKIWRQKGTGRARHGARSAPIFVGGGVSHGPTGDENYQLSLNKKMRQLALRGALTAKVETTAVITGLDKIHSKTKDLSLCLSQISGNTSKTLLILDTPYQDLIRAAHNLPGVSITQAKRLNAYEILQSTQLIFTKESLNQLLPASPQPIAPTKTKPSTKKS